MKINNWREFVKDNLSGKGLEIGAYFQPFLYNKETTKMLYQDKYSTQELIDQGVKHNPEARVEDIVNVDVVCDTTLSIFDNEFDFVCCSHVLEHLPNPILAITSWIKIVKFGGYLYLVVPDRNFTFDKPRVRTENHHLFLDYYTNKLKITEEHYLDFYANVHPDVTAKEVLESYIHQKDIHVHTFEYEYFIQFLTSLTKDKAHIYSSFNGLPFEIVDHKLEGMNICVLLRRI